MGRVRADARALCFQAAQALARLRAAPASGAAPAERAPLITERRGDGSRPAHAAFLPGDDPGQLFLAVCRVRPRDQPAPRRRTHHPLGEQPPDADEPPQRPVPVRDARPRLQCGLLLGAPYYVISIAGACDRFRDSAPVGDWLFRYAGRAIEMPHRWLPDPQCLETRLRSVGGSDVSADSPFPEWPVEDGSATHGDELHLGS